MRDDRTVKVVLVLGGLDRRWWVRGPRAQPFPYAVVGGGGGGCGGHVEGHGEREKECGAGEGARLSGEGRE